VENLRFIKAFRQAREECGERVSDLDDEALRECVEGTHVDPEDIDAHRLGDAIAVHETSDTLEIASTGRLARPQQLRDALLCRRDYRKAVGQVLPVPRP